MNHPDAFHVLRELKEGNLLTQVATTLKLDKAMSLELKQLRQLVREFPDRMKRLLPHGSLPIIVCELKDELLLHALVAEVRSNSQLYLTPQVPDGTPPELLLLEEQIAAHATEVEREAERMRRLLLDATEGREVLPELMVIRSRQTKKGKMQRALLDALRRDDTVLLNDRIRVGGMSSAPAETSFDQRFHAQMVTKSRGEDAFEVAGIWSAAQPARGERVIHVAAEAELPVRAKSKMLVDQLVLLWRTGQAFSAIVRTFVPLGSGSERFEIIRLDLPAGFWQTVETWANGLRDEQEARQSRRRRPQSELAFQGTAHDSLALAGSG